jgi:transposase
MTKAEQTRLTSWRLKLLQQAAADSRNVARTCRHFGISRKTFYKWKRRFDEHGAAGLGDQPRTPHCSPRATPREVVSKILYLREHYHFGPGRIADYLRRFHRLSIASSSVHRILERHGMNRLPANQKHRPHKQRGQRYEKPQPGHRLQMDVKFLERIPGTRRRLFQFTAIDDCTRIRVLKVYDQCNQTTAIQFIDDVVRRFPFRVLVVQTDNGAEFQSRFHWHLESLDIRHVYIRPRTPRLNGKVERSPRVDDQEFYQLLDKNGIADNIHLFNQKLREWEDYYNYHRPMGRWTARPRTNDSWQRRERDCHQRPETSQKDVGGVDGTRTRGLRRDSHNVTQPTCTCAVTYSGCHARVPRIRRL